MKRHMRVLIAGLALALLVYSSGAARIVTAQDETPFPLAEPGPFSVGDLVVNYQDEARDGRRVTVLLRYPAVRLADAAGQRPRELAEPDRSGAPYPLIITGTETGSAFDRHLPSHGFVMAIVSPSYGGDHWDNALVDYPRNFVFALDQLASNPPEPLAGIIDTDRAGVVGYSWEGYLALAVSGVRIDPEYYLAACANSLQELGYPMGWDSYFCPPAENWDSLVDSAGSALTTTDDGLWQPITDERIRAVAPLAPDGRLIFGPRGLVAVDRPTLMIAGTKDTLPGYTPETTFIFEHLGTADRTLISFVGEGHMMVFSREPLARMRHFVTAFFGYQLQGREEYIDLYSQAFVEGFEDLAWGVYSGE